LPYTVTVIVNGGGNIFEISGNVEGSTLGIVTVKAFLQGFNDYVLVSGTFNNGSFNLKLPDEVADEYLGDWSQGIGLTISNPAVKTRAVSELICYNNQNNRIGKLRLIDGDDYCMYLYNDRDGTITGTLTGTNYIYDLTFNKGWRLAYVVKDGENFIKNTTTKPIGRTFKWVYTSD